MLKNYCSPEIEIVKFQSLLDVLNLSCGDEDTEWNDNWDDFL